jgi:hypothetical protein
MNDGNIKRCTSKALTNAASSPAPAVAFLDTSETTDKTSLVVLCDNGKGGPWEYVEQSRLDVWTPKDLPGGVIDPVAVEARVRDVLAMFTGLRVLKIDTRGRPWAIKMFGALRKLSHKVRRYDKTDRSERNAGFAKLAQRMTQDPPRIVLQDDPEQTRELKFARLKRDGNGELTACDPNSNREKNHLDIVESAAMCCFLIAEIEMKAAASGGMARIAAAIASAPTRRVAHDGAKAFMARGERFGADDF